MQQTENYKLNLIETSDPFSPDALNKNAETLAAQLARVDAAAAAETVRVNAALDAKADRTALAAEQTAREAVAAAVPKFACGTYVGNGAAQQKIGLSFTPRLAYVGESYTGGIQFGSGAAGGLALPNYPAAFGDRTIVAITSGGFLVYHNGGSSSVYSANISNTTYRYFAIG